MDPISQGALGALVAQSAAGRPRLGKAAIIGGLAAMAPDLDVLIQSSSDPLLALQYHRHFTHSLFFAPLGGLLCGLLFYQLIGSRWSLTRGEVIGWSLLGFFSHGPLDLCTSYGTSLLWPLTDQRLSLDVISVIDPIATIPMVLAASLAVRTQGRWLSLAGLVWLVTYLCLGAVQQSRVESVGSEVAQARGHQPNHLRAMPSLGNLLAWRVVYEFDGRFFVDGVGAGPTATVHWAGSSAPVADLRVPWAGFPQDSLQWADARRFAHFSQGYIGLLPDSEKIRVGDMRYAEWPEAIQSLWGITLDPFAGPDVHADVFWPVGRVARWPELWSRVKLAWVAGQ